MRRRTRRLLLGAGAVPVAFATLLGVEVQMARMGPALEDATPLDHDGRVGGDGPALRMVWLGDSTAAGEGASSADAAMPRRVARALGRPVDLTVRAVSGDRIADVIAHQLAGLDELEPDVVLVSIGANDVVHLTTRDDFRDGWRHLLDGVPERALLVLLGVPDMGAPPRLAQPLRAIAGWRGRALDAVTRDVADDGGIAYVDIAGETGPQLRADPGRTFAADRYHPNDDGYALWAMAVLEVLVPRLAERPGGGAGVDR